MSFDDYLPHLFCLIDEEFDCLIRATGPLRHHGRPPTLHDGEVLTMVTAGEFLGIDTDKHIHAFFRRYHGREFPNPSRVHRTTFVRQAANLWRAAQLLHGRLVGRLPLADGASGRAALWLIDSFPLHACRFARAEGSRLFKGRGAAFGHDHVARGTSLGFRACTCAARTAGRWPESS